MGEIFAKLKKNAVLTTKQNIFYVIKSLTVLKNFWATAKTQKVNVKNCTWLWSISAQQRFSAIFAFQWIVTVCKKCLLFPREI